MWWKRHFEGELASQANGPLLSVEERAGAGGIRATSVSLTAAIVRIGSQPWPVAAPERGGASVACSNSGNSCSSIHRNTR